MNNLLTITGNYWHFHAIGTGVIFTYHTTASQIIVVCSESGTIVDTIDRRNSPFLTPTQFFEEAKYVYIDMIDGGDVSLELSFYDNPTLLAGGLVEVDLELFKN